MKTSLVSREVIADSIELVARGHLFDAMVVLSGCDKTIPGTVMALARLDIPGVMLYGGSIRPGRFEGHDVTIQDVFEAVGAHATGRMSDERARRARGRRQPGRGRLRRAVHGQHDGRWPSRCSASRRWARRWSPPSTAPRPTSPSRPGGSSSTPSARRHHGPARSSRARAWRTRSPRSPAPAARPTRCCTCSPSRARSASSCRSTTSTRSASGRRCSATSSPAGSYVAVDLYDAGGVPLVAKRLLEAGLLHEDALTVTGPHGRRARARGGRDAGPARRAPARRPDQGQRRPGDPARQPRARGLRRQALGPRAPPPRRPRAGLRRRGGGDGGRRCTAASRPVTSS